MEADSLEQWDVDCPLLTNSKAFFFPAFMTGPLTAI